MPNGIYLTLEQYKDKDLPITITINGHTYHSQFALATAQATYFEMGKQHGMELGGDKTYSDKDMTRYGHAWYDEGYTKGYDDGKKANGYSEDDIKQLHTDNEYTRKIWYDKGKAEGYAEGYNDGISKINLNTEPVEQTELSKEYDKGFTKGYEEGKEAGKKEALAEIEVEFPTYKHGWSCGFNDGFEEGKSEGYDDGYKDCREVAKMLNKYGIDEDGPCNDCKEEPGRDEDGPEQTEYAKGYEDGRMDIMQFIGNNRG